MKRNTESRARGGRLPRAGVRATRRIDLRLTDVEYAAVSRLADANGLTLADAVRLGILWLAAALDEDIDPPVVLGGALMLTEAPLLDGFLPPNRRSRLRHSP